MTFGFGFGFPRAQSSGLNPSLTLDFAGSPVLPSTVTFSRGTNATLTDSLGAIVYAPANMIAASESFTGGFPAWALALGGTGTNPVRVAVSTDVPAGGAFAQSVRFTFDKGAGTTTADLSELYNPVPPTANILAERSIWAKSFDSNTYTVILGGGSPVNITPVWQKFSIGASAERFRVMIRGAQTPTCSNTADILLTGASVFLTGKYPNGTTAPTYAVTGAAGYYAPRFDYDPATLACKGLLIEEARTNSIRNNTMVGAAAGTPGTAPTNWTISPVTGVTISIIGTGVESGISYIDIRYVGTPSAPMFAAIKYEPVTGIAGLPASIWSNSAYVRLVGGSLTNISAVKLVIANYDAGSVSLNQFAVSTLTVQSTALNLNRYSVSSTAASFSDPATAFVVPAIQVETTAIVPIDVTLRIGLPQMELGAFPTSAILTSTATATRNADVASIDTLSPWYNATQSTIYAEADLKYTAGSIVTTSFNDATANNRFTSFAINTGFFAGRNTAGAGALFTPSTVNVATLGVNKMVLAVADFDVALCGNGGTVATAATYTVPVVTKLELGNQLSTAFLNGWLRRVAYYPSRLPNATLQSLTA